MYVKTISFACNAKVIWLCKITFSSFWNSSLIWRLILNANFLISVYLKNWAFFPKKYISHFQIDLIFQISLRILGKKRSILYKVTNEKTFSVLQLIIAVNLLSREVFALWPCAGYEHLEKTFVFGIVDELVWAF